ncbi:MBL fold metallo-hydrolase [Rubritalea spongiae]|uniref:MBL fold metallo-hydrolase n=1 Tax=Rubritalea spongiae TaxID=430797 RepID=A0ABW5E3D2_9BACT
MTAQKIHSYTGGHVFTNGYVVEHDGACIIIDAPALIHEVIQQEGLKPTHLLLTHQHFDHTEDVEALQDMGIKVLMHSPYNETLIRQKEARENWGLPINIKPFEADELLDGKDSIAIKGLEIRVSHVPGHSPDSITFYLPALGVVFAGDTLMEGSIGRTDLPGGSHETLLDGIRSKLYALPDETVVCSGHGSQTTIGREKSHNPFI